MSTVIIMPSPASDCTNPHDRETDADTFEAVEDRFNRKVKELQEFAAELFADTPSEAQELGGDFCLTTLFNSIHDGANDALQRQAIGG